jgi:hypothetical protein
MVKMNEFTVEWDSKRRTPESITFPGGAVRKVKYMRDGLILFADGKAGATYERLSSNSAVIKPVVNRAEAVEEALNYQDRMGRVRR